jgi:hypothetical protein
VVGQEGPAAVSLRYSTHALRIVPGVHVFKRVKMSSCIS